MKPFAATVLSFALSLACGGAFAQPAPSPNPDAPLPTWEKLTPEQRDALIAPMRDRWNAQPGERVRMLDHAQRWREMSPAQRERARHGMKRWENLPPEQREEMRAFYERTRDMSPEQRKAERAKLKAMTPEQRRAWLESPPR